MSSSDFSQLLFQERLSFYNPASVKPQRAFCDWYLWLLADGTYVSLALDNVDNPGPSVTNAAEAIADAAFAHVRESRLSFFTLPRIRFFEAYPRYFHGELIEVDEVVFGSRVNKQGGYPSMTDPWIRHRAPGWLRFPRIEFIDLVGAMPRCTQVR